MAVRLVGYAIVSTDGMIADADGRMTETLLVEADQVFYRTALASAQLIVHGRNSAEPGAETAARRRVVVTTRVAALCTVPDNPRILRWNPNGAPFADVLRRLDLRDGIVAIVGGTAVFDLFLAIGYDAFYLSRSRRGALPGGRPVFRDVPGRTPEEVLLGAGMQLRDERELAADLTLATWERAPPR